MRVLVTGASGFLGSHVAERLAEQGHDVVALVRKSSNKKFLESLPRVELALGAIEDKDSVLAAARGVDAVVHSAGLVKARNEAEFFAINTEGTRNVLEAAQESAPGLKRFVFVSSLAAIGPSLDGKPVPGDMDPRPVTHYGRSKLAAEKLVLEARDRLPVVVLRPPMIYGPRDNESFAFFQSVSRRFLPFLGDGLNTMSVIYASDAAQACIHAIEHDMPSGSAYFLSDGEVYVWRDMLGAIETALARKALVRFSVPMGLLRAAALGSEGLGRLTNKAVMLTRDKVNELSQPHWVCDSSSFTALGWQPQVKWAEGTRRAAEWYRKEGWL
ncbi:MAG: NAD(P)-dependent oxidoreductase [Polyangiaceae bacterium]